MVQPVARPARRLRQQPASPVRLQRGAPAPNRIITGDCLAEMRSWSDGCIDHCIVDPPFNIGSGSGRKGKNGLAWAFSSHVTMQERWDAFTKDDFFAFNVAWLTEVARVVRPNGNILVFGTYHNVYQLGFILQNVLDRRILNSVVWFKPNAQPNITARTLTESTEQIIWAVNETPARATGWTFNYWDAKEMNGGKQMRNVWDFPVTSKRERAAGKHPSQKPLALLERAVLLASKPGDLILDPFGGAGTLALAAQRNSRRWLLIENVAEYAQIAQRRLHLAAG
ncbi:MAG TPA: site-specific DNA-methyltransferase [Dehalococcoidia bacterium]|nr:site-specific DNA-methyltransferase [Dehalococcoidia bacterium]